MEKNIEFMYLSEYDLKSFGYNLTKSEWDEIIVNLDWVNSYSCDAIFWIMKQSDSYMDFIKKMVETKGTFPDSNGVTIQHKEGLRRMKYDIEENVLLKDS
jgi:hypothetical protein